MLTTTFIWMDFEHQQKETKKKYCNLFHSVERLLFIILYNISFLFPILILEIFTLQSPKIKIKTNSNLNIIHFNADYFTIKIASGSLSHRQNKCIPVLLSMTMKNFGYFVLLYSTPCFDSDSRYAAAPYLSWRLFIWRPANEKKKKNWYVNNTGI